MPDDYENWRRLDIERVKELVTKLLYFVGFLRHSSTESFGNERQYTEELKEALLGFINERLGGIPGVVTPPALLDDLVIVDGAFIDNVLRSAIPNFGSGVYRQPKDMRYWLPSQRDAGRIIGWSMVNTIPWERDIFDCDDHAEALRNDFRFAGTNACAYVLDSSAGHAYNMVIFPDRQYWFLEPQSDTIVPIGSSIYTLERGMIWI